MSLDFALAVPRLNVRSPIPLHVQGQEILRRLLSQERVADGELLPDEVSLSRHWGVSRNTVRAAIAPLVNEGLLERRSGVGTRVCRDRHVSGIGAWSSFSKEMQRRGVAVDTLFLRWGNAPPTPEVRQAFALNKGTRVLSLERVRGWDGVPAVCFQSYLHPRLGLKPQEQMEQPLYEWIFEKSGVKASRSIDHFSAVAAELEVAQALGIVPGLPLLQRKRVVYDIEERPVEYAVVYYRSDRFTLSLSLEREDP